MPMPMPAAATFMVAFSGGREIGESNRQLHRSAQERKTGPDDAFQRLRVDPLMRNQVGNHGGDHVQIGHHRVQSCRLDRELFFAAELCRAARHATIVHGHGALSNCEEL